MDDICPTLQLKLQQKLIDDPGAQLEEQDFQDFEMGYLLSAQDSVLLFKVNYSFLASVLEAGSKAILDRVWQGTPIRGLACQEKSLDAMQAALPASGLRVEPQAGTLLIALDSASLGDSAAERQRCMQLLAMTRTWLLIGPLVERLRWLRESTAAGGKAGSPPASVTLQLRRLETCWIISKPDRVLVITAIHFEDEVDVTLARTFCQEFADSKTKAGDFALPCSFNEPKDIPSDLKDMTLPIMPNVGFLTMTLSDQAVKGASDDRLHVLAKPVMTLRNFFHFHLKHVKSYLHSRLRRRIEGWQTQMNGARRPKKSGQEVKRLATGKVFVPQARAGATK